MFATNVDELADVGLMVALTVELTVLLLESVPRQVNDIVLATVTAGDVKRVSAVL